MINSITQNTRTIIERINKDGGSNTVLEPSDQWLTSCIYFALLLNELISQFFKVGEGQLSFRRC